jgi:hypothetical protein
LGVVVAVAQPDLSEKGPCLCGTTKSLRYEEERLGGRAFEVDGAAAHEDELVVDGLDGGL